MTDETPQTPEQDKVALITSLADDPAARDLVGLIFEGMRRDAVHTQSMMDRMWGTDRAEREQLRHGITWVLSSITWGGTTREYEAGLDRLRSVLYPDHHVRDWYEKQLDGREGHPATVEFRPFPGYRVREGAM